MDPRRAILHEVGRHRLDRVMIVFPHFKDSGPYRVIGSMPYGLSQKWVASIMRLYAHMLVARGRYDYDDRAKD